MKKFVAWILSAVCVLGLCACGSTNSPNQGETPDPEAYAFETQYIRTNGYSEDRTYPYHVVIDSREELEDYYEANKEVFYLERNEVVYSDTTIGFLDACDKYDDAYFERQNLVLIILEEGSGSIRHEITDVRKRRDENGASLGWDITIKRIVPEMGTDDMAQWHLFLEVQMGKVMKDEDQVWINDKLSVHGGTSFVRDSLVWVRTFDGLSKPYENFLWADKWSEGGWMSSDGMNISQKFLEVKNEIPQITYPTDLQIYYEEGVEFQSLSVYNSDFEEIHHNVHQEVLDDLADGTYYLVITVKSKGEYIETEKQYEYSGYECVFKIVIVHENSIRS